MLPISQPIRDCFAQRRDKGVAIADCGAVAHKEGPIESVILAPIGGQHRKVHLHSSPSLHALWLVTRGLWSMITLRPLHSLC